MAAGSTSRRRPTLLPGLLLVLAVAAAVTSLGLFRDGEDGGRARPPAAGPSAPLWLGAAELAALPTSGSGWEGVVEAAEGLEGAADLSDQDSTHDTATLAAALVWARTGDAEQRRRAAGAVLSAIGTEEGGRTLALGRNLVGYVVSAQLVDLRAWDADGDRRFRSWLADVLHRELADGRTLVQTHETRPNNWGAMAGAARVAADAYLGDYRDLERAARVFRGYLGERDGYASFAFGDDLSWQADPSRPAGVNPPGATRDGRSIDGALPDDMRRGCPYRIPPCETGYAWEALQGALVQAQLLSRQGYDAWEWGSRALLRAARYLFALDEEFGGWAPEGDDAWQPWLLNRAYSTRLPAETPTRPGKNMGFTDWTHAPPS